MQKEKIIAVVGPTASGKTDLAVKIAKKYNGEIISADSMQIYKGMNIATAKPTADEMQGIVHHLIDFLPTDKSFSVVDFVNLANEKIKDILSRGKLPIIAGGTGLYVSSLVDNIQFNETKSDVNLRKSLCKFALENGNHALWLRLFDVDPETARVTHENNITRVVRAIEIFELTGVKMSSHRKKSRNIETPYDCLKIGIKYIHRDVLYEKINLRVESMIKAGLIDEAKMILNENEGDKNTAMQAIGYKELVPYFDGEISLDVAIKNIKQESRHYAKRQLTWFNHDGKINWFYPDERDRNKNLINMQKNIEICIDKFLNMCYDYSNSINDNEKSLNLI